MYKSYKIENIPWNPYKDQFITLLERHRGHKTDMSKFIKEHPGAKISFYIVNDELVSMLRYFKLSNSSGNVRNRIEVATGLNVEAYYYINMVHTKSEQRGKGYASKLFDAFKLKSPLVLEVESDNEPAIRLYKSKGFEIVSEYKGDYIMVRKASQ
jgi:ribosomal protein S18 acetylase RimI-like enzyme